MNQNEMVKLFSMVDIDYPSNQIAKDPKDRTIFVARWMQKLESFDSKTVYAAYEVFVNRSPKFAPGWQDLIQIISESMCGTNVAPEEAWGKIKKAVRRYGWTEEDKALEYLGENIGEVVKRFGWDYFCQMPITDESTYYSQFRNAYQIESRRKVEVIMIPEKVKSILPGIGGGPDRKMLQEPARTPAKPPQPDDSPLTEEQLAFKRMILGEDVG